MANLSFIQNKCYLSSYTNGWWQDLNPNDKMVCATKIALIHSEISEALEGMRKDKMDEHLPHRTSFEVELADAIIRIFDLAGAKGFDLERTIEEKLDYNNQRPDHKLENRTKPGGKKI